MADDLSPLAAALRDAWVRFDGDGVELWNAVATAAREHLSAAKPAATTERPTCATCPALVGYPAPAEYTVGGQCWLNPEPVSKSATEWCMQHPAMAAWIAARAEGGR